MKNKKRSPLHDKPLNQAGQSLHERLVDTIDNKIIPPLILLMFFVILTFIEWLRSYSDVPNLHWVYTGVTIILFVYYFFSYRKNLKEIENIKLELNGEKIVAEKLNELREMGYKVYNDIVADKFNLDHLVIGPAGVFTIETKTYRKNIGENSQIYYDGESLKIDDINISNMKDPIKQAMGQKYWLEKILSKYFKNIEIKPVVIFPEWYINGNNFNSEVWVFNEKSFISIIKKQPQRLTKSQVDEISRYIENYIRK